MTIYALCRIKFSDVHINVLGKSHICHTFLLSVGTTVAASGTLFALVMVGRAIFVFSLANFANFFRHASDAKIDLRQQVSTMR